MNVTGIALVPPQSAQDNPCLTPELLASVLARYSRSNLGLDKILSKVDLDNADASIDRILRFVDYGHASIGGLTGGIAVALDGVSMWLAYRLFDLAQMSDGQESSTRYISMDETALSEPEELGIPEDLAGEWKTLMLDCFGAYQQEYDRLDKLGQEEPERIHAAQACSDQAYPEKLRSGPRPLFYTFCDQNQPGFGDERPYVGGDREAPGISSDGRTAPLCRAPAQGVDEVRASSDASQLLRNLL